MCNCRQINKENNSFYPKESENHLSEYKSPHKSQHKSIHNHEHKHKHKKHCHCHCNHHFPKTTYEIWLESCRYNNLPCPDNN